MDQRPVGLCWSLCENLSDESMPSQGRCYLRIEDAGFRYNLPPVSTSPWVSLRRPDADEQCCAVRHAGGRSRRFVVAAGLGLALGRLADGIPSANAEFLPSTSVKDVMDQAQADRAAKQAAQAALPKRPTELRDRCGFVPRN